MKTILALLLSLSASWGITNVTLPYLVDTASIPKVRYVDKNDSALKWGINNLGDTVNAASGTGVLLRSTNPTIASPSISGTPSFAGDVSMAASLTFTTAASGGSGRLWKSSGSGLVAEGVTGSTYDLSFLNPAAQPLLRNPTGTQSMEFPGAVSALSTLGVTGKLTGSDTVAAVLGFRAGNTAASNVNLYRLSADMWKTDDSLTVAGKIIADSIVCAKLFPETTFTFTSSAGFSGSPTSTGRAARSGKIVVLNFNFSGTSNSSSFVLAGLPSPYWPARTQIVPLSKAQVIDNGNFLGTNSPILSISTSGSVSITLASDGGGSSGALFTTSGTKSLSITTVTYSLQ